MRETEIMLEAEENNEDFDDTYLQKLESECIKRYRSASPKETREFTKKTAEINNNQTEAGERTLQNENEVKSEEALSTRNSETIKQTLCRSRISVLIKCHNTKRRLKFDDVT